MQLDAMGCYGNRLLQCRHFFRKGHDCKRSQAIADRIPADAACGARVPLFGSTSLVLVGHDIAHLDGTSVARDLRAKTVDLTPQVVVGRRPQLWATRW